MNKNQTMVKEGSNDFESWNVEDESNKPIQINILHDTNKFVNILQLNKGQVYQEISEFSSIWESLNELYLDDLWYADIQEISEWESSNLSKSSNSDSFDGKLFISSTVNSKVRSQRSQIFSDLLQSNMWDKHWKETPSVEILCRIMPS